MGADWRQQHFNSLPQTRTEHGMNGGEQNCNPSSAFGQSEASSPSCVPPQSDRMTGEQTGMWGRTGGLKMRQAVFR